MSKQPETYYFDRSENIPNHPELPALIYRDPLDSEKDSLADEFALRFKHNEWNGIWRWGVYGFHHYHSNAHEVLGVVSGQAELKLGGPDGRTLRVQAGDVIILPAGTGHKSLESSSDFEVIGAYPSGQENKDLIRNRDTLDEATCQRIKEVELPKADPVFGRDGPLLQAWH